ncbi:hypothetical protein IMZ31_21350 (plasmid) [Pontibacillus sp. ALD_SL1]|uniref:hypothetical protein n=1 Tax=Pontibacillus sp. ALD_SL1 TaxID=2777185 RepID=UPI001A959759|nr:hypothetical protein [Pontibacillus sp. ALD_SL1]QST03098.1 hypothetical protein IMZ31_21350 [Pontibacillus sp. ALD_SL1]
MDQKNKWGRKWRIKLEKIKNGVFIDVTTEQLKKDVEFILYNLPKSYIKGIEIIEKLYDVESETHQIIVKQTMNAIDIKRQIGRFVFREGRWDEQEAISTKLLAEQMIDEQKFYDIYNVSNYLEFYEIVNADVFAVSFGNETMSVEEIGIAINSLYIKEYTDKSHAKKYNVSTFVEDLFAENK